MILMQLRDYLKEKKAASLGNIARHFDIPESAAQNMLEHWVRKGCAVTNAVESAPSCRSGCGHCKSSCGGEAIVYRWQELH